MTRLRELPLGSAILAVFLYPIVFCIIGSMFWWSIKVMGIEPKNGEKLYHYKYTKTHFIRKRRGYWNAFRKEEIIPYNPTPYDLDIYSLYPPVKL